MPFTIQHRLPIETRYLTMFADLHSIPALLKMVAIHPMISAMIIMEPELTYAIQQFFGKY